MKHEDLPLAVGGQAVLEGVMMRSPHAMAVAVRRPDGSVILKDEAYHSLAERYPVLKRAFLRGPVILIEAMVTGVKALTFSAQAALQEEDGGKEDEPLGWGSIALTLGGAFLMAFLFFGFLPHWLSGKAGYLVGRPLTPADFTFHAIDGLIKLTFIILYIWGISFFPDIRRVFEYHGAEHKSICTFEAGEELTVAKAKAPSHRPRPLRHLLYPGGAAGEHPDLHRVFPPVPGPDPPGPGQQFPPGGHQGGPHVSHRGALL